MTKRAVIALAAAAALLSAGAASAQTRAQLGAKAGVLDAAAGRQLAERLCASCHNVSAGASPTINADVPSFASIAGRPGASAEYLAGRIIIPHPAMPETQLTVAEIRNVIAYIVSLKSPGR